MLLPFFVGKLLSELAEIKKITKRKIFNIARAVAKRIREKREQEGWKFFERAWLYGAEKNSKFACMDLAKGNIQQFKEYYYNWQITEIYDLLSLRMTVEFEGVPPK